MKFPFLFVKIFLDISSNLCYMIWPKQISALAIGSKTCLRSVSITHLAKAVQYFELQNKRKFFAYHFLRNFWTSDVA